MTAQYSEKTFASRIAVAAHHEITCKSGRTWPLAVGSESMGRKHGEGQDFLWETDPALLPTD